MIINFDWRLAIDYVHNHSDEESWKNIHETTKKPMHFFHKLTCLEAKR